MTTPAPSFAETELGLAPGLYPFASHFLDSDGARLHYIDEGRGPCLFMVHGNPTWSFIYRKLVLALRTRFRCVALDLPGFGLSRPPPGFGYRPEDHVRHVRALLDHLDLEDAALVAHDWGGPIGLAAALAAPRRLTRFILGNTLAWPVNGNWYYEMFAAIMGGPFGRWGAYFFNFFVNGMIPFALRRGLLPPAVMDAYRAPFQHSRDVAGTYVFPAAVTGSGDFLTEVQHGVQQLDGRNLLLIWPDGDIAFRAPELARWREMFPQSTVVPVARCGHFIWEEAAEDCVSAIQAWPPALRAIVSPRRRRRTAPSRPAATLLDASP